jgi:uncharacterized protein YjbI with pentapeptide repeats
VGGENKMADQSTFINSYRSYMTQFIKAYHNLKKMNAVLSDLGGTDFTTAYLTGAGTDISADDFNNAVGSVDSIVSFADTNGHEGNLYKLIQGGI